MSNNILITDSLFILPEHEARLKEAGFNLTRFNKAKASEGELCQAVQDKVGYILGGVEQVTEKVIDAANKLKVISVAAIGYPVFIPAWEYALQKGIAVTYTPDGPTQEVAEWAVTASLMMSRQFLDLGRVSQNSQFIVTKGIEGQSIGIIGLGRIGSRIADMIRSFRPKDIFYYSLHRHEDTESEMGLKYSALEDLLGVSDVIFVCLPDEAQNFITSKELDKIKKGALLVNITHPGIIVEDDLYQSLQNGSIRAISDYPMGEKFASLPLTNWYCMNTSNTVTEAGVKLMSDTVTSSIINFLATGDDQYRIDA